MAELTVTMDDDAKVRSCSCHGCYQLRKDCILPCLPEAGNRCSICDCPVTKCSRRDEE